MKNENAYFHNNDGLGSTLNFEILSDYTTMVPYG